MITCQFYFFIPDFVGLLFCGLLLELVAKYVLGVHGGPLCKALTYSIHQFIFQLFKCLLVRLLT